MYYRHAMRRFNRIVVVSALCIVMAGAWLGLRLDLSHFGQPDQRELAIAAHDSAIVTIEPKIGCKTRLWRDLEIRGPDGTTMLIELKATKRIDTDKIRSQMSSHYRRVADDPGLGSKIPAPVEIRTIVDVSADQQKRIRSAAVSAVYFKIKKGGLQDLAEKLGLDGKKPHEKRAAIRDWMEKNMTFKTEQSSVYGAP